MPTLPLGVYLIKVETPKKNFTPEYAFYYVSDLYVMSELQPKKKDGMLLLMLWMVNQ